MAEQWDRDPATGDYLVEDGSPVKTASNDLRIPAYHRLRIPREKWLYAPNSAYGSGLQEVKKNILANATTATLTKNLAEQALQPLIDDGRARSADVVIVNQKRNAILFLARITDENKKEQDITIEGLG